MSLRLFFSAARLGLIPAMLAGTVLATSPAWAIQAKPETESAQSKKCDARYDECDEKSEGDKEAEKKKEKIKKLVDWVKGKRKIDGLFGFYRDPANGDVFMEIRADQLKTDFIYFSYTLSGASLDGLRSLGSIGENYVLQFRRRFNRVDFIKQDTLYSYDEGSTLEGQKANVLSPLLATAEIVAKDDEDTRFVVKMNEVFQGKDLIRIGELSVLGKLFGAEAGALNKEKSNVRTIRNYSDNSGIVAEYVFDYPKSNSPTSAVVTIQHTFVPLPADGFQPRPDDPRVGFFTARNTSLSAIEGLPYRDKIYHWRLDKRDPAATQSEPVKPITYWIENTTPLEYRDTIKAAVLRWNAAFERLGYKNAVRVEIQPDDANWDAGDVGHNVIRWIASPVPRYAGYGPTVVDPRTGEILGADIVLEHATIQRWLRQQALFTDTAAAPTGNSNCTAGAELERTIALSLLNVDLAKSLAPEQRAEARERIIREGLYYLVLHEVGHTLGLSHNMMGSYYKPMSELNRPDDDFGSNLTNSVMDYPQVNLAPRGVAQGPYFPTGPGPYDYWAIAYAYDGRMADSSVRDQHLARSSEPQHAFGNDADAMGAVGLGMDPRVIPYDLSSEPVKYAVQQMDMIRVAQSELVERMSGHGRSWDELRRAHELLMGMYRQNATVVSRYVGGIYVDRAFIGQPNAAAAPFRPVARETQKQAMELMARYVFAPEAFELPGKLGAYLQFQRRGFDFYGRPQDPPLHSEALAVQGTVLGHLLHPNTLQRMNDSSLYGNRYSVTEMLTDLTGAMFDADSGGTANGFRRNLQVTYVQRMIAVLGGARTDAMTKGAIYGQLRSIDKVMGRAENRGDAATKAHRRYLRQLIKDAFDK